MFLIANSEHTENRFNGEMGTDENSIIQVKENLTKKPGDRVNYALVNKLVDLVVGHNDAFGQRLIHRSVLLLVRGDWRRIGRVPGWRC